MDKVTLKAASDRLFADMAGAMTAGLCYVGTFTGLFRAIAGKGPLTYEQVVLESGLQPRYVEEWDIKSQAYLFYAARR